MALRELDECDAAISQFQKALELDPSMWLARGGEALCYIKKDTEEAYKKAIELDKILITDLEKMRLDGTMTEIQLKANLHTNLERLATSLWELDEDEEALKFFEQAFSNNNRCDTCVCAILELYNKAERHEDVMKFFRSLDEPIAGLDYTRLSESLMKEENYKVSAEYFDTFTQAAFQMDEIPFAFDAYRNAVTAARKQHKPVQAAHLELCLASLYDRYGHDYERAARIWERILDTYRSIKAETEIAEVKWAASINLARHCLKRSVEVGKNTSEAERCGAILERLAKVKAGSETTIGASESTTMLGAWYKLMGRNEEADACFRVQVKEGLRMLSDDDPTNDMEAYWNLVCVLTAAGDDQTAIGLFWDMRASELSDDSDDSEEDDSESDDEVADTSEQVESGTTEDNDGVKVNDDEVDSNPDDDMTDLDMHCDGCLRGNLTDNIAICRYCYDVGFCQNCFAMLKSGELRVNICSPKHSWWTLEPRPKEAYEAHALGKLWIDGQNVTINELKEKLAAQWKI
jgi:tetratricopeptide (TPR) repeat protein